MAQKLAPRKQPAESEDTWGPYGLNLLYEPPGALIDLVFVHGLRGGSIKTWCKDEDPRYFWPQNWLPREPDLSNARTPILLIGHSMGGLVIKKAYLLARQEPRDTRLADRIQCMLFLATPHRGSDSARLLNNILKASTVFSSRQYITDIFKGSPALQVINDEFRAFADELQIWTFYETLKTRTSATSTTVIVDRDSAVLGYKGEIAQPLNADHRSICKFDSPADPNYVTIRNSLSKAVEDLLGDVFMRRTEEVRLQIRRLEIFLMISSSADDDLITTESNKTDGTCDWAIHIDSFEHWKDSDDEQPTLYWLTGEPGAGKSVVTTHIIRHLQDIGADVCHHFFRHGRKSQQSLSGFLRQIAYQMALIHPAIRETLCNVQDNGVAFDKDDERALWRKLFMNEIFKQHLSKAQYWIIDGLDECVDASKLFGLISKFESEFPLRFYIATRKRPDFERHFHRFEQRLFVYHINTTHTLNDIRAYISHNSAILPVAEDESGPLIERIVKKSRGIFLWAKLALEELENVYSDESVDDILDEMPEGMAPIYYRILEAMAKNSREIKLTQAILAWTVCGVRALNVDELQASLKFDLGTHVRSIERSVDGLCGQLLQVNKSGHVNVIHTTYLVSEEMRSPRSRSLLQARTNTTSVFANYACTAFSEHVLSASAQSDELLSLLCKFLRTNVLSWVEYIAQEESDLYHLTRTARNLRNYLERRAKYTSPLSDDYRLVEMWATDLIRVVSKFSRSLLAFPSAVFYLVAPLCPRDSAIFHQFGGDPVSFKLHGSGNTGWDDCVSYIDYRGVRALSLAVGDTTFAIGKKDGQIKLYNTATCQEILTLIHGEPVKFLKLDNSGRRLLASGNRRLAMFTTDGDLLWELSQVDPVVTAAFSENDETIAVATKGSSVQYFSSLEGRLVPGESIGRQDSKQLKVATRQAILHADISPDLRLMAIVYRGRPAQVWSLERDVNLGPCWFSRDTPGTFCLSISEVLFNRNPAVDLLAVASQDGELAIFNPWTQKEVKSVSGEAYTLACSSDGRTLATGDMLGTIKIWDFDTLTLLYSIKSEDYAVRSLAFSGDSSRLYDIRDDKTKVWEPAVLVRKSLSDESSVSESVTQITPSPIVDRGNEATEIMHIAATGIENCVIAGREDGSVVLFDAADAKLQKILYSLPLIQVWKIGKALNDILEAQQKILDIRVPDSIHSISLSPSGSQLLICESSKSSIYQISNAENDSASRFCYEEKGGFGTGHWAWLPQPLGDKDIAMISSSSIHLMKTDQLDNKIFKEATAELTHNGTSLPSAVKQMSFASNSRFLAIELESTRKSHLPILLIYDISSLQAETISASAPEMHSLSPLLVFDSKIVRRFIGWRDQTLVFIDTDLWICSVDLVSSNPRKETSQTYLKSRHCFIPYELIGNSNGVAQVLTSQACIAFPHEGALSVIEDAFSWTFAQDEIKWNGHQKG
ncbi:hypothetical protein F5Y16DRAFT_409897 [Xylariaceae sp. FL0255]|nr:hypothetical protein F5Y16DRAFT_409897 [Xylariaceae sp. FL0255]